MSGEYTVQALPNYDWHAFPPTHLFKTYCEDWHAAGIKGAGIVIAIVDSGIDTNDAEIMSRVVGGINISGDGDSTDIHDKVGHGGIVAKIIHAIAPEASLYIIKVFGSTGSTTEEIAGQGLLLAAQNTTITLANASLGGPAHPAISSAVTAFFNKNKTLVASAGNSGDGNAATSELNYPGAYDHVITVGAVDRGSLSDSADDWLPFRPATYSSSYPSVDCVAIGRIPGYWMDGTSFSAPVVTGILALRECLALNKPGYLGIGDDSNYQWLIENCRQLAGQAPVNDQTGHGLLSFRPYSQEQLILVDVDTLVATKDGQVINLGQLENRQPGGVYGWFRPLLEAAGKRVGWDERLRKAKFYL